MRRRGLDLSVIGALVAAAVLLGVGIAMAVYEEQVYTDQQLKSVREQAQILAASVSAAVLFDDRRAAQEYVNAVAVNPEMEAAGVYDRHGQLLAGFGQRPLVAPRLTLQRLDPLEDLVRTGAQQGRRSGNDFRVGLGVVAGIGRGQRLDA